MVLTGVFNSYTPEGFIKCCNCLDFGKEGVKSMIMGHKGKVVSEVSGSTDLLVTGVGIGGKKYTIAENKGKRAITIEV